LGIIFIFLTKQIKSTEIFIKTQSQKQREHGIKLGTSQDEPKQSAIHWLYLQNLLQMGKNLRESNLIFVLKKIQEKKLYFLLHHVHK
jgi:hypothetical protein